MSLVGVSGIFKEKVTLSLTLLTAILAAEDIIHASKNKEEILEQTAKKFAKCRF